MGAPSQNTHREETDSKAVAKEDDFLESKKL
jgi:hypothetical protein